jgi:hypothetical protein
MIQWWMHDVEESGYVSILAYLDDTPQTEKALTRVREILGERTHRATLRGYGPRYLHSIGQLYKGGPPTGAYLLITADDPEDAPIPGADYTFSTLKMAQALGDAESLAKRGRPVLHVHLAVGIQDGLESLVRTIQVVAQ